MRNVRVRYTRYGNDVIAHSGKSVPASTLPAYELINVPRKIGSSFSIAHGENSKVLHISKLSMNHKRQGKGVAGEILKNWALYAKRNKYREVIMDVSSENKRMLRVMEKLPGWKPLGKWPKGKVAMRRFILKLK